jgi:hypothetical protein
MIRNLTLSFAILAALSAQILRSVFVIKFQTSYLRRTTAGFALFLVGLTSSTLEVKAVLVSGLTIVTANEGGNPNMTSDDAINGNGLSSNTPALSGTHSATWSDHWYSATKTPQITIDLGDTYSLTGVHIWNYNEGGQTGRGLKDVIINVSPDADTNNLAYLGSWTFAEATGFYNYTGFDLDLTGLKTASLLSNVRYFQIVASGTHGTSWDSYGGLAEIQFDATAQSVPDTGSTAALLGAGVIALGFARRRLG